MPLRVKKATTALEVTRHEVVWPGDSAVDLEASDLEQWAKSLGESGLVIKPGESPDKIIVRPLSTRELNRVIVIGDVEQYAQAARYGVVRIPGIRLLRSLSDGLGGMDEAVLDSLMVDELKASIPWLLLCDQVSLASTGEIVEGEERARLIRTELGYALGAIILALTFRGRRHDA